MRNETSPESVLARAVSRWRSWQAYACRDGVLVAAFLILTVAFGSIGVIRHPPPMDNFNMVFSVMVATGRGFVEPAEGNGALVVYPHLPELVRFLKHETPCLSPEQIPANLETRAPDGDWPWHHMYLFYAVGLTWRVFGMSWGIMQELRVLMYCAMVLATYGLFRLAVGRLGSALATAFLAAGLYYDHLLGPISFRDFSKGAFMLPAMFIIGYLATRPVKTRTFWALAALLGLLLGFGYGFRGDLLVCIPPALFALAVCRRPGPGWRVKERLVAAALMLTIFAGLARPLVSGPNTAQFSHDVCLGFATKNDDLLNVSRASYERLHMNSDLILNALPDIPVWHEPPDPGMDMTARRNLLMYKYWAYFPADMITRAYAAVLYVVNGNVLTQYHRGLLTQKYLGLLDTVNGLLGMPILAALALLILARRDLRVAWTVFPLCLFFSGYLSIQAESRHAFHLSFVPLWILACLLSAAARFWKRRDRCTELKWWTPANKRMLQFALPALLSLAIPLYALRIYQDWMVGRLLKEYDRAERTPVPTEPVPLVERVPIAQTPGVPRDWVLFQCPPPVPAHSGIDTNYAFGPCYLEYWVAEFTPSTEWRPIWLQYNRGANFPEFSTGLWLSPSKAGDSGPLQYFFPVCVYSAPEEGEWLCFSGIAVPKERMGDFKGLYRVKDEAKFTFLMNLCLPADRTAFARHQTLSGWTPTGDFAGDARYWMDLNPLTLQPNVGEPPRHDPAKPVEKYQAAVAEAPRNVPLRLGLALAFEARGDRDGTLQAYGGALAVCPSFYAVYHYVDAHFLRQQDVEGRIAFWRAAAEAHPDVYLPSFHLARALEKSGRVDEAIEAYRGALNISPADPGMLKDLGRLLSAKDRAAAMDAYERALQVIPTDPEASECLGALKQEVLPQSAS